MKQCTRDVDDSNVAVLQCVDNGHQEHRLSCHSWGSRICSIGVPALFAAIGTPAALDLTAPFPLEKH
jgi:hypothetical protein